MCYTVIFELFKKKKYLRTWESLQLEMNTARMSATEILICNKKECCKEITDVGWVTVCSHIFCNEHGRSMKRNWMDGHCYACAYAFQDESNIIQVNVNPSSTLKSMMLSGLSPTTVLEIASNSLAFWNYQKTQENMNLKKRIEFYRTKTQTLQTSLQRTKDDNEKTVQNLMSELDQAKMKIQELKIHVLDKGNLVNELERKLRGTKTTSSNRTSPFF